MTAIKSRITRPGWRWRVWFFSNVFWLARTRFGFFFLRIEDAPVARKVWRMPPHRLVFCKAVEERLLNEARKQSPKDLR